MSPMNYIHIRNYSAPEIYVKCDDILRVMRRKSVSSQKINKSLWKHATYLSNELQEGQTRRLDWRAAQRQKEKPISKTRGRHEDTEKVRIRSWSGAEQWAGCSRSGLREPGNKTGGIGLNQPQACRLTQGWGRGQSGPPERNCWRCRKWNPSQFYRLVMDAYCLDGFPIAMPWTLKQPCYLGMTLNHQLQYLTTESLMSTNIKILRFCG